jgi:hypothetical protein
VDELKSTLNEVKNAPKVSDEYEVRIQELGHEIGSLREQLALERDRARKPSPELISLRKQLEEKEASTWHTDRGFDVPVSSLRWSIKRC